MTIRTIAYLFDGQRYLKMYFATALAVIHALPSAVHHPAVFSTKPDLKAESERRASLGIMPAGRQPGSRQQLQQQLQQQHRERPAHPGLISAADPKRAARLSNRSFYAKSTASEATNRTEVPSLTGNPPAPQSMHPMGWMMPQPGIMLCCFLRHLSAPCWGESAEGIAPVCHP